MAAPPMQLPPITEVVAEFRRALDGPGAAPDGELLALLLELHRNNVVQWNREDTTRSNDADDRAVAAAKRDIDALNARRHELVEAVDAALAAGVDQATAAPPTTESPAMVFDRLSVLVIRISFTESAARSERADRGIFTARLPVLHQQLAILQQALDALFDDVRTGRRHFVPYQSLKLYGSASRAAGNRRG